MRTIEIGEIITCTETGKAFVACREGISVNYARDSRDNIYSNEGVDLREKKELLDRSKPFYAYLSMDGKHITGWKGNILGIAQTHIGRVGFCLHGCYVTCIDVHGGFWYGKNAGMGMCITLYPKKRN